MKLKEGLPYFLYEEYDKGAFECGLSLFSGEYDEKENPINLDICYSAGNECILGRDFSEVHRRAVEIFADEYGLVITA